MNYKTNGERKDPTHRKRGEGDQKRHAGAKKVKELEELGKRVYLRSQLSQLSQLLRGTKIDEEIYRVDFPSAEGEGTYDDVYCEFEWKLSPKDTKLNLSYNFLQLTQ